MHSFSGCCQPFKVVLRAWRGVYSVMHAHVNLWPVQRTTSAKRSVSCVGLSCMLHMMV